MGGVHQFCVYVLHMKRMASFLAGGSLACMSGSIVLLVLEQFDLGPDLETTLVIEASFGVGLDALVVLYRQIIH